MNDLFNPFFIAFCAGALWLVYLYAGYPLLLAVLARSRHVAAATDTSYRPMVSVLIAARNEEKDIAWKIAETLAWSYPVELLEILIGSDASDDHTDEIVRGHADPRVRLVRMERRGGKGRVLNTLAQHARGELLLFTDANSHIGPDCLAHIVSRFADPQVGCVTGHSYSGLEEGSPVAETGTAVYWGHELLIKHLEDKFGSVLACDGALFSVRRSLYAPVSPELANDLELPLIIAHAGYRIHFEPRARVLEKDTVSPSQEFARRRRICAQGALAMWRLRHTLRGIRAVQFFSHKLLRWLTLVPMVLLLVSSAALATHPVFAALLAVQLLAYTAAAAGAVQAARSGAVHRLLSIPLYVVVSSVGAFTGILDALSGRRFDIWESPALTRGDEPTLERVARHQS